MLLVTPILTLGAKLDFCSNFDLYPEVFLETLRGLGETHRFVFFLLLTLLRPFLETYSQKYILDNVGQLN